jgi:hypothetical protein
MQFSRFAARRGPTRESRPPPRRGGRRPGSAACAGAGLSKLNRTAPARGAGGAGKRRTGVVRTRRATGSRPAATECRY